VRRRIGFILVIVLVVMLAGCSLKEAKKDIFDLVEKNYDTIAAACKNKDSEALLAIDGITQVNIVDGYVLVYCTGAGIAPSSQDYGFYYSEDNIPVGVSCSLEIVCCGDTLQTKGNGLEGKVDYNTFYTEHIKGNFYFYSNTY